MGSNERIRTGVPGLDEILGGGLSSGATYLLKGQPGTGKTTLGLQFLVEGARRGQRCLYLCLAETRGQLVGIAEAYGVTTDGIDVHELRHRGDAVGDADRRSYTVFGPAEVELEQIARELVQALERVRPARLVLDSLSEIRLLSEDPHRYRRELLDLCDRIAGSHCTGIVIDVETGDSEVSVAETLVSGVIHLEQLSPSYGGARRRLRVTKLRASRSIGGYHDFSIGERGIEVYPRLVAAPHRATHVAVTAPTGLAELDSLLGGGLDSGTSTLLMGPPGTGKSTLAAYFVAAAAARDARGAMFCFDESPTHVVARAAGLGIGLREQVEAGRAQLIAIDPAELSPGELSHRIRERVEAGTRVVVLDSINGYLSALPEERFLAAHLHELLAFLAEKGVTTILTLAGGRAPNQSDLPVDISYVADTVLQLCFMEEAGEMKQAVSVLKKRTGSHERSFRELRFGPDGLQLGPPRIELRGRLADADAEVDLGDARRPG